MLIRCSSFCEEGLRFVELLHLFLTDSTPEWEDPELQREIKAATGIDLKRKGKGKGRGKHSNLTDLRESGSSSRKRLESKIFKRYDV